MRKLIRAKPISNRSIIFLYGIVKFQGNANEERGACCCRSNNFDLPHPTLLLTCFLSLIWMQVFIPSQIFGVHAYSPWRMLPTTMGCHRSPSLCWWTRKATKQMCTLVVHKCPLPYSLRAKGGIPWRGNIWREIREWKRRKATLLHFISDWHKLCST